MTPYDCAGADTSMPGLSKRAVNKSIPQAVDTSVVDVNRPG